MADGFGFDLRHPADLEVFRLKRILWVLVALVLVGLYRPFGREFIGLALSQTIFICSDALAKGIRLNSTFAV